MRREDAFGRRCWEVSRSNICREACALRHPVETGKPVVNLPVRIRDAADRRVPVTVSTALLHDRDGRMIGGVETFRDLNLARALLSDVERLAGGGDIVTADPGMRQLQQERKCEPLGDVRKHGIERPRRDGRAARRR